MLPPRCPSSVRSFLAPFNLPYLWRQLRSYASRHSLLFVASLIAILLRVAVVARGPIVHYPDEIFQTQEPAHRLAFGYGVVSWEWRVGARSWVFPAFLAGVMRATEWMGPGSAGYRWGIVIVLAVISLTPVWFASSWARQTSGREAGIVAAGLSAIWFPLVYFAPKTLTEVIATHLWLPGLYVGAYGQGSERRRMFVAGVCCGLAACLRMPLTPAALFAAAYFCHFNWRRRTPLVAAGLILPCVAFGLVDLVTWGQPFHSFLTLFWVDVVRGHAALSGTEPWYWYLPLVARWMLGPLALVALAGFRRNTVLGWITLIILASHSLISHKEMRYIYPIVPLMVTLAACGFVEIGAALKTRLRAPLSPALIVLASLGFCALVSAFSASRFPRRFARRCGAMRTMIQLSRDPSVCGVGLTGIALFDSGGYTYLHRKVPILVLRDISQLDDAAPGINALLTDKSFTNPTHAFSLAGCTDGACLYKRVGPCAPALPSLEANAVLLHAGD